MVYVGADDLKLKLSFIIKMLEQWHSRNFYLQKETDCKV